MTKIDLKKELKHLYHPSAKQVSMVDVPPMNFLMIDGQGDPNTSQAYQNAIEALFSVSYTLKFMIKKGAQAIDYGVMPLEGLWWTEDMARFSTDDKNNWLWTAMIMQPEYVTEAFVKEAVEQVTKKKGIAVAAHLRFECFHEGRSAQILHIGPFSAEKPNVDRVHAAIEAHGCRLAGKHHEIYLSDFRKALPEKLKTIIRQPMI
ncbi:hypothetical protein U14_06015 [Candidatus Moduliflexus flocculans]|uniref:GyrI-like small molecule binding domain-containing protein n=1 Tax=Candidatus Moduliflexus flocculans TaxID=1499966 RepID=A0A081BTJ6_9BACT|nr:hypothetical protein U14_06015 [Candidatus Moduliflexus flocculans]